MNKIHMFLMGSYLYFYYGKFLYAYNEVVIGYLVNSSYPIMNCRSYSSFYTNNSLDSAALPMKRSEA
jgi:hypothetical protein